MYVKMRITVVLLCLLHGASICLAASLGDYSRNLNLPYRLTSQNAAVAEIPSRSPNTDTLEEKSFDEEPLNHLENKFYKRDVLSTLGSRGDPSTTVASDATIHHEVVDDDTMSSVQGQIEPTEDGVMISSQLEGTTEVPFQAPTSASSNTPTPSTTPTSSITTTSEIIDVLVVSMVETMEEILEEPENEAPHEPAEVVPTQPQSPSLPQSEEEDSDESEEGYFDLFGDSEEDSDEDDYRDVKKTTSTKVDSDGKPATITRTKNKPAIGNMDSNKQIGQAYLHTSKIEGVDEIKLLNEVSLATKLMDTPKQVSEINTLPSRIADTDEIKLPSIMALSDTTKQIIEDSAIPSKVGGIDEIKLLGEVSLPVKLMDTYKQNGEVKTHHLIIAQKGGTKLVSKIASSGTTKQIFEDPTLPSTIGGIDETKLIKTSITGVDAQDPFFVPIVPELIKKPL